MYLSLLVCFCTYYSPEIDYETKKQKKLRNDSYIFFFLLIPKYIYSCAVHAARFFPVQNYKKNTHTSISFYMSLRFFLNGFYFVRAFYFSICYEVSLRQNCRSVYYYLNVLCFIG